MRRWDDNNFGKNEVGLSSVERFIFHNSKKLFDGSEWPNDQQILLAMHFQPWCEYGRLKNQFVN